MDKAMVLAALVAILPLALANVPPGLSYDPPYPPNAVMLPQNGVVCNRAWIQTDPALETGRVAVFFSIPDAIKNYTTIKLYKLDTITDVPLEGGVFNTSRDPTGPVSTGAFVFTIRAPPDAKVGDRYKIGVSAKDVDASTPAGQVPLTGSIGGSGFFIEIAAEGTIVPDSVLGRCVPLESDTEKPKVKEVIVTTASVIAEPPKGSDIGIQVFVVGTIVIWSTVGVIWAVKKRRQKTLDVQKTNEVVV